MPAHILTARWVLPDADTWLRGGGVVVRGRRIERVLPDAPAVRRAARRESTRAVDLGDVVLTPGFVNAHAHLELSALADRLPERAGFTSWIEALLAVRARVTADELARAMRRAADVLLASGTTSVGDIDSSGAVDAALGGHPLRVRAYREALDAGDSARTEAAYDRASRAVAERRTSTLRGLAPHAPYTVSDALFARLGTLARRRRLPLAIHWAESTDEVEWLEAGDGAMQRILRSSPRAPGLALIERAGLLGRRTTLIHGNHPARGDLARIRASGASVVHCPGTHAFFDRAPFDLRAYREADIPIALGTDSLASNRALDMRREMALARAAFPWLAPRDVWDMATRQAARAIALAGRVGELVPGAWADLCAHPAGSHRTRGSLLETLTARQCDVTDVWIGGRRVLRRTDEAATSASKTGSRVRKSARATQNGARAPHDA